MGLGVSYAERIEALLRPRPSALSHLQLLSPPATFGNRTCPAVVRSRAYAGPREYGFLLVGYVVMPEHVHLLISEPDKGTPSTVLQMLKQRVSGKMRKKPKRGSEKQLRLAFLEPVEGPRSFWQARFYDFNVYTTRKKREKLEYMHRNPVTRGLVKHPKDWLWSSWSFYAKNEAGLARIDLIAE